MGELFIKKVGIIDFIKYVKTTLNIQVCKILQWRKKTPISIQVVD